ncbi:MAG: universal stress protein [Deltaproteobacteria bacterium]|nr:universal stress protein [Deltaproteobacteria bacterium]
MKNLFPTLVCPGGWGKLMVCTDGSDEGQNAVAVALELAVACDSQVIAVQVLHVVPEFQAVAPDLRATLGKGVRENMAVIKAAADKLGVALKTMTPEGQTPHAAIVATAEKIHPDLVIMGRCGKSALARILMGNVTARVIGLSPTNVLVVPRGGMIGFQRILVASDGSSYSQAAWELALAMAKQAKSRLIGVAVAPEEGDIIEAKAIIRRMLTAASLVRVPFKGVNPQGVAPDTGIVQQAIKHEVDLIIVGSYGRTGLRKLLMGSVTERVIGGSPCPILVVKQPG